MCREKYIQYKTDSVALREEGGYTLFKRDLKLIKLKDLLKTNSKLINGAFNYIYT